MVSPQTTLIVFLCCSVAHFIAASVMALFARHQVKYLAIAWILGIFAINQLVVTFFVDVLATKAPGMLHPYALMTLMSISYLQSIYPLSIPMPGYLQWGRMWKYASPAIVVILFYIGAMLMGSRPVIIHDIKEFSQHLLTGDVLMRQIMVIISFWYIINIFRLPHRLTHVEFPRYLVGYSTMLGLSVVFYLIISINYDARLMLVYVVIFTLLNLYLCFRTLETTALELPKPVITTVKTPPTDEEIQQAEQDFNEANLQRFQRTQFWMQNHKQEWTDSAFTRDTLCREIGLNRHLMLQCVRSQGYNNVHDYINSYRIQELKRRIQRGEVSTLTECLDSGFGAVKTVRSCFLRHEGITLDQYMKQYART